MSTSDTYTRITSNARHIFKTKRTVFKNICSARHIFKTTTRKLFKTHAQSHRDTVRARQRYPNKSVKRVGFTNMVKLGQAARGHTGTQL